MAKAQKRSNREIRKPKKKKESAAVPATAAQSILDAIGPKKKKG